MIPGCFLLNLGAEAVAYAWQCSLGCSFYSFSEVVPVIVQGRHIIYIIYFPESASPGTALHAVLSRI